MNAKITKYLVIAPTPFYEDRGCHFRIRGEAEGLKKLGHKVVIATYGEGEDVKGLKIKRTFSILGHFQKGPASSWKKIPADIFLFFTALNTAWNFKPQVIYCHLHEGVLLGFFIRLFYFVFSRKWVKLVFDSQGSLTEELVNYRMIKNKYLIKFFISLEKLIEMMPDIIFVSSTKHEGMSEKVHLLPDAISLFNISQTDILKIKKEESLEKLTAYLPVIKIELIKSWMKEGKKIIVYTGSFGRSKGLPQFLSKVFPRLIKNKDICFLLGGGDIWESSVNSKYRDIFRNRFVVLNNLNSKNLVPFLSLGNITIDPKPITTKESSGKIINYMAMGLPVVCFDQDNNQYFLDDGGIYAKSYKDFNNLINKLLKDKERQKKLGKKNFKRVWGKFNWQESAKKINKVINI